MFNQPFFANLPTLLFGAFAGLTFGFLLRKAHVSRFEVIVRQLLLKDFTVMKVIFTAVIVGSIGIYAMLGFNLIDLDISNATIKATLIGGAIFGVGMAVLGYCPGTGIAALADGARDMIFGLIGMFSGAFVFAELYPSISKYITIFDDNAKNTLSSISNISPWIFISVLSVFTISFFYLLERKNKKLAV